MPKTKSAKEIQVNPPVATAGRGQKICPWCSVPTAARAANCKHCGKPLREQPPTLATIAAQLDTIKALGGVAKVKERIAKVRQEMEEFRQLGGIDQAEQLVEIVDKLKDNL